MVKWGLLVVLLFSRAYAQQCDTSQEESTPASRFTFDVAGTVKDKKTGLMWKRCAEGQSWNGKSCGGKAKALSLVDTNTWLAQANSKASSPGGFNNWRLPTQDELMSLIQSRCTNPTINLKVFPGTPAASFWTASQGTGTVNSFWAVDFKEGFDSLFNRGQTHYVRLVRKP